MFPERHMMMHEHQASTVLPSSQDVERAVQEAHRRYRRTLAGWAGDLLVLRQAGRQSHAWRTGDAELGWWRKAA